MDINNEILKTLKNIEKRLDQIETILECNNKSCKKMDEHINFIDNIYDNVRKPFSNILSYYQGNIITLKQKAIQNDNLLES